MDNPTYNLERLIHTFLRVATSNNSRHQDLMNLFHKSIAMTPAEFLPFLEKFKNNFHYFNGLLQKYLNNDQKNKIMSHYQFIQKGDHSDGNDMLAVVMVSVVMKKLSGKARPKVFISRKKSRKKKSKTKSQKKVKKSKKK